MGIDSIINISIWNTFRLHVHASREVWDKLQTSELLVRSMQNCETAGKGLLCLAEVCCTRFRPLHGFSAAWRPVVWDSLFVGWCSQRYVLRCVEWLRQAKRVSSPKQKSPAKIVQSNMDEFIGKLSALHATKHLRIHRYCFNDDRVYTISEQEMMVFGSHSWVLSPGKDGVRLCRTLLELDEHVFGRNRRNRAS